MGQEWLKKATLFMSLQLFTCQLTREKDPYPNYFGKLDPDPDPHKSEKLYPDPHQSLKGSKWSSG
jgi:hypothetical protein